MYLGDLPTPLGGAEDVEVAVAKVASQQHDQSAVAHEDRVVVAVHLCTYEKYNRK